ncbi:hypothetical protein CEP70_11665 [Providencia stuartii]|nr:hypothetical protein BGK56_00960 [Providencia stuartii]AVL40618.1 hypothetical protein CEP70_11665 [Providencia stuartii]AXO20677.1 hypothetical protein MC79_020030 [Providencia stuartii]OMH51196.1 hypothetical protein BTZ17_12465 [Providencia stuartii]SUC42708.1 Uncharacterised protein [Providencia stuartii]
MQVQEIVRTALVQALYAGHDPCLILQNGAENCGIYDEGYGDKNYLQYYFMFYNLLYLIKY